MLYYLLHNYRKLIPRWDAYAELHEDMLVDNLLHQTHLINNQAYELLAQLDGHNSISDITHQLADFELLAGLQNRGLIKLTHPNTHGSRKALYSLLNTHRSELSAQPIIAFSQVIAGCLTSQLALMACGGLVGITYALLLGTNLALIGLAGIVAIVISTSLHELGHYLAAAPTRDKQVLRYNLKSLAIVQPDAEQRAFVALVGPLLGMAPITVLLLASSTSPFIQATIWTIASIASLQLVSLLPFSADGQVALKGLRQMSILRQKEKLL